MKNAIWENIFRGKSEKESEEGLALKHVPIFDNLKPKELTVIEKLVHHRSYKPDEFVFKKDAPGEGLYIILKGNVEIFTETEEGNKNVIASLKEGDFLGDLSLLDKQPRSASAISKDNSRMLGFFRPDLSSLLKRKPDLGAKIVLNLASVIGERLRKTNELLEDLQSK